MQNFEITKFQNNKKLSDKVFLVFPHWGSSPYPHLLLKWCVPNTCTILYHYSDALLSDDLEKTKEYFTYFEQKVMADTDQVLRNRKRQFFIYGMSLGTVMAARTANLLAEENADVSVVLNLSGASFPFAVWNGEVTRDIRRTLEARGKTLRDLETVWGHLSPARNLDSLRRCKILSFLSLHDEIICPENVCELDNILKSFPLAVTYFNRWLHHKNSGIKNLLRIHLVRKFLCSEISVG